MMNDPDEAAAGLSAAAELLRGAGQARDLSELLEPLSADALRWTCGTLVRHFHAALTHWTGSEATARTALELHALRITNVEAPEMMAELVVNNAADQITRENP